MREARWAQAGDRARRRRWRCRRRPNQRWSLDFVSDTFATAGGSGSLRVVDDFTRECLALVADTSLSGGRVARELDAIIAAAASRSWWSATTAPS